METTIPRLLLDAAERFADRTAVEEGEVVLSFPELANASLEATRALLAAGIEPGDRVA